MPVLTDSFTDLARQLRGELALPGDDGYALARPWNVAVAQEPAAVVIADDAQDVVRTVRFAADNGLRVAVQRTGHGAVPGCDGDVLLVHTGRLDAIEIDAEAATARVGAGAIWQQVIDAGAAQGLAPLVGSAPGVGVAGFLTGGGIGPLTRSHGVSSDRVRAFDLVTGDGRLLHVTPEDHADLFWGLRGGKSTLGIVCAVELELLPVTHVHGGALVFAAEDAAAVLRFWASWSASLPEHANTSVAIQQLPAMPGVPEPLAGRLTVAVRFTSTEDAATCEALLAPLRALATPVLGAIGPLPFTAIGMVHADPVDPLPSTEQSALLTELPAAAIEALLRVAGPDARSPQIVVELRLLGGAYARPGRHRSAFCHRDAAYSLLVVGVLAPEIAAHVPEHQQQVIDAIGPWTHGGRLPNFSASSTPETIARCYDDDTRVWLAALAERHDPAGVLRIGQVVRT